MDILDELNNLHPEEQVDGVDSDADLFRGFSDKKKKKKKKDKLFSEVSTILDGSDIDACDKFFDDYNSKKSKKKKSADLDGDLFDTKGKGSKKTKNVEAKFKSEFSSLQKLLKDNEETVKVIKETLGPIMSSKARGSSKMLVDLLISLNSANGNRLSVIKEIGALKKSIIDLNIKLTKDDKKDEDLHADEFGSRLFDSLFKQGRSNVVNSMNSYEQSYSDYVNNNQGSFEDMCNERLNGDEGYYRSPEASIMIENERRQPEIVIRKSFTGEKEIVAIDNEGIVIENYPVPDLESLGKLTFTDNNTCIDITGRTFKVIEV